MAKHTKAENDEPEEEVEDEFAEEQAAEAEAQGPSDEGKQVVPERRPQGFLDPGEAGTSEAGKRAAARAAKAHGEQEYKAAEPKRGESEGRFPHLFPGQRIQIIPPNEEAGRMGLVQIVNYTDDIQQLIANSGTPEARFATADSYVVLTRDGRSDTLNVPADELTTLEGIAGWGRGQI